MRRSLVAIALALAVGSAAVANDRSVALAATKVDADFAIVAARSHDNETRLARLELARGSSDEARSFANRMLEDHPPLVAALAAIVPPARASEPTAADRLVRERLERLHGTDFDQQYVLSQVAGHLDAVAAFETEVADGRNARLRAYAKSALPTIREHLAVALAAAKHIGGDSPFKGAQ